jgi:hypothetical protein
LIEAVWEGKVLMFSNRGINDKTWKEVTWKLQRDHNQETWIKVQVCLFWLLRLNRFPSRIT